MRTEASGCILKFPIRANIAFSSASEVAHGAHLHYPKTPKIGSVNLRSLESNLI